MWTPNVYFINNKVKIILSSENCIKLDIMIFLICHCQFSINLKILLLLNMSACAHMHMSIVPTETRRRWLIDPLELELQRGVSHLMWVLGIELGSSGRKTSAVNCWASPPAHFLLILSLLRQQLYFIYCVFTVSLWLKHITLIYKCCLSKCVDMIQGPWWS